MTFTDMMCSSCETGVVKSSSLTIGQALERCLSRAVAAQRVTVGIQECAKLLGCASERVMLCVIPDMASSPDVGLHIQHTLVRSFCWENDIRLLTVKNCEKLQNIVLNASYDSPSPSATSSQRPEGPDSSGGDAAEGLPAASSTTSLTSCVLVEAPSGKEDLSPEEDFVCNYHDTVIYSDIYPKPVIQLPV